MVVKKKRFGLYKTFLNLKINASSNFKILKFKKTKWKRFLIFFKSSFLKTKYKKFKFIDQTKIALNKKSRLELNYKQNYKKRFICFKILNTLFGNLKQKYYNNLKTQTTKNIKSKIAKSEHLVFLKKLENRLDFVLWQSKFCSTLKMARQIIFHGQVLVNNITIKNQSFNLKSGDLISLNLKKFKNLNDKCLNFSVWPLYPNFLVINYKTMEIIFLSNCSNETNSNLLYPFNLNLRTYFN